MKFFSALFGRDALRERGITLGEEIGSGTYSTVYEACMATARQTEEKTKQVAIKIIDLKTAPKDFIEKFLPREIQISKLVYHPNLLEMIMDFESNHKYYIVTEKAKTDLLQYLRLKGGLRETLARRLFYELICGINHLHENNIVHRDIKCENLLLTGDGTLKIADYGFARQIGSRELSHTFCGSTGYSAPEVLEARIGYDPMRSDVWSCGIILFVLLVGTLPYSKNQLMTILKTRVVNVSIPLPYSARISEIVVTLLKSILTYEPDKRTTLSELKDHEWFKAKLAPDSRRSSGFSSGRRRSDG